jgi:hypothetical protein
MADMVTRVTRRAPYRVRAAAVALAVAGILFVLYPALRPYTDETTLVGQYALNANDPGLLDLAHQVRFGPGMVLFGAGLVLLAAGGILTAITVWRDRGLVAWGGVLTGIAVALYLPQFFGPPPVRMAHGVLLAVGCLWLAMGLWGRRAAEPRPVHNGQLPGLGVPAPRSAPWP